MPRHSVLTTGRVVVGSLALVSLVVNCGGGGGGGGGGGSSGSGDSFVLADVKYGRLLEEANGVRLVSPLTTVVVDPITGNVVPGSLATLAPSIDSDALQSLGLGTDYLPRVIPRNGVLQLEFTEALDPTSVYGDVIDADGNVVTAGTVQLRTQDGRSFPFEITVVGSSTVWIDPVTPTTIGLPPSPIDFGPAGEPRADATGFLKLVLPKTGATIRAQSGTLLGNRSDHLSNPNTPVGLNPGNSVLDFIAQNQLIPTNETFNGFLPDVAAPRMVRTHSYGKVLSSAAGDGATLTTLTDVTASFSTDARGGLGEWAGARLVVRPGLVTQEIHPVALNSQNVVTISGTFAIPPADGNEYRLERAEFFEPDLADPIDDALFDPNNPENANNTQLDYFVEVDEIDAAGNLIAGAAHSLRDPGGVPPFSQLRVRFSEAMAAESFGEWETFRVAPNPDNGPDDELLTQILLDAKQTTATIRPARIDQAAGTFEIVGWGRNVKALQLIVTAVPRPGYLQQRLTSEEVADFLDLGIRGLLDLGGQPVGFPDSFFVNSDPVIRYAVPFVSNEAASTQNPPPVVSSWGVTVHRHQGRPTTGIDPVTDLPGVAFQDQVNLYGPIADINLQANGFLAGSPVVFLTKIHDDYFPPPHGQFGKFPFGTSTPLASAAAGNAPAPHDGARFQHVYRDIDASPSRDSLQGTLLDLYRVSWAPIGGNVTSDTYDDISVHAAHSSFRPKTNQNSAAAADPYTGLAQTFDFPTWESLHSGIGLKCKGNCVINEGPNYWDQLVTTVAPGTTYKIAQTNLFAPPFDGNAYHAWPAFTTAFQYNNGDIPQEERDLRQAMNDAYNCSGNATVWYEKRKYNNNPDLDNLGGDSLLLEYRIRPQTTNISRTNGFSFSVGVLLDSWPKFRAYSIGATGVPMNPDNISTEEAARCAVGRNDQHDNSAGGGDNSRYFAVFDYIKTTSKVRSPYVRVNPSDTQDPDYYPPIIQPPLADQPAGTQVLLEYEGATTVKGASGTGFSTDIDDADASPNLAYRATLVGNTTTLLLPNFDLIAIPYRRPSGN